MSSLRAGAAWPASYAVMLLLAVKRRAALAIHYLVALKLTASSRCVSTGVSRVPGRRVPKSHWTARALRNGVSIRHDWCVLFGAANGEGKKRARCADAEREGTEGVIHCLSSRCPSDTRAS